MRPSSALICVAVLTGAAACSGSGRTPDRARGEGSPGDARGREVLRGVSSVSVQPDSGGEPSVTSVSHRYLVRRRIWPESLRVALEETTEEHCCLGGERDASTTLTVARWPFPFGEQTRPLWRVTLQADGGTLWDDFYRATLAGCCDQTDAMYFVDLSNGRVAFTHSREEDDSGAALPTIHHWASGSWRYVAFHDRYTPADPSEARQDSAVVGALQYGTVGGATQRVLLVATTRRAVDYRLYRVLLTTPRWQGRRLDLPTEPRDARPPAAISGFSVRVDLASESVDSTWIITVPVTRDRLAIDRASLPRGFALREIGRTR
jgi:hypothetical protein